MNIKNNINSAEYASIGLSVIGTIAAVVTQQIAYIATPLTLSLSLNLINRQKELGKATKRIAHLEQQSQAVRDSLNALPAAPTTIDFDNLQQSIFKDREELKRLRTVIFEIKKKDNDLLPFLTEIDLTKDSLKQLGLNFSNFKKQFSESQDSIRVTNTDLLLQEVAGNLSNISADFLDIESLDSTSPLKDRSLNLEKVDGETIDSSIEELKFKIQSLEENSIVPEESIKQIGWRFLDLEKAFDDRQDPIEIASIHRSLSKTGNNISNIVDAVVADKKIADLIQQEVDQSNRSQFEIVKQLLPKQYSYTLVSGRSQSRDVFIDALEKSQQRLILVCPWLTEYAINPHIQDLIRAALNRGVRIDIGWGNLGDVENGKLPLSKESLLNSPKAIKWGGYNAVNWVYDLQAEFTYRLNLQIV
jgi:hypothetical protein